MKTHIQDLSRLVALPHSVFALPFALSAYLFAQKQGELVHSSLPEGSRLLLVVFSLVFARTAAMAFNRSMDAEIDAANPRTENREIPRGRVSQRKAILLCLISTALFVCCTAILGLHCLTLAPAVLLVLFGYSLTKRFTSYSHIVLGLALAAAPGGAWWVLRPKVEAAPLWLMLGVLLWVSGFDVLYSCQDVLFDRKRGLHSIPAAFGVERSLSMSFGLHLLSFLSFLLVGQILSLAWPYFAGMLVFGSLLLLQHRLLKPHDLSRINQAFFTANGCISILYLVLSIGLVLWG